MTKAPEAVPAVMRVLRHAAQTQEPMASGSLSLRRYPRTASGCGESRPALTRMARGNNYTESYLPTTGSTCDESISNVDSPKFKMFKLQSLEKKTTLEYATHYDEANTKFEKR